MSPLSEDRLNDIRQRRAALQSLPWVVNEPDMWNERPWLAGPLVCSDVRGDRTERADMEFIAHAPEDITFLLQAVYGEQATVRSWIHRVEQLRDLLREIQWSSSDMGGIPACPICYTTHGTSHDPECRLWLAIRTA